MKNHQQTTDGDEKYGKLERRFPENMEKLLLNIHKSLEIKKKFIQKEIMYRSGENF